MESWQVPRQKRVHVLGSDHSCSALLLSQVHIATRRRISQDEAITAELLSSRVRVLDSNHSI